MPSNVRFIMFIFLCDACIIPERLQFEVLHQSLENEDEILLAIAGIKQVLLFCLLFITHRENSVTRLTIVLPWTRMS